MALIFPRSATNIKLSRFLFRGTLKIEFSKRLMSQRNVYNNVLKDTLESYKQCVNLKLTKLPDFTAGTT